MNGICIHYIKGTTMGKKFAAVGSNSVVKNKEIKMFVLIHN